MSYVYGAEDTGIIPIFRSYSVWKIISSKIHEQKMYFKGTRYLMMWFSTLLIGMTEGLRTTTYSTRNIDKGLITVSYKHVHTLMGDNRYIHAKVSVTCFMSWEEKSFLIQCPINNPLFQYLCLNVNVTWNECLLLCLSIVAGSTKGKKRTFAHVLVLHDQKYQYLRCIS